MQDTALADLTKYCTPAELLRLKAISEAGKAKTPTTIWAPHPENIPQQQAYESKADILYYGGQAGGGKTDLLIGLALTQHKRSIIFRREYTQIEAIESRLEELLGNKVGYNSTKRIWRLQGRQIKLGGMQKVDDWKNYQGRAHDLLAFDEITHFLEIMFRSLMVWNRSTTEGQRTRIVCAGNPPTDSEGEWVIRFWGPWLDKAYPNPAEPGELRWFAVIAGKDVEVEGPEPFEHEGEEIVPKSRTFIPASVKDNPFLWSSDYQSTLQSLPEPLRSIMLKGDFSVGQEDNPWQVIPIAWIQKAQDRWTPEHPDILMSCVGLDVARGGNDSTVATPRYGNWFGEQATLPGKMTPDGQSAAALAINVQRDGAPIHVDVIGVGGSVVDHLQGNDIRTQALNGANKSSGTDKTGRLKFVNKRAEWFWRLREALDPDHGDDLQIPPNREIRTDLASARWKLTARGIQIESKEDIIARIKRSPDKGESLLYSFAEQETTVADFFVGAPTESSEWQSPSERYDDDY